LIVLANFDFRPDPMDAFVGPIFHISIIIGIFYAWTIGFNRESKYRPGKARNMKEEFYVYGLPLWFMYVIGGIKVLLSSLLILGFFLSQFTKARGRNTLSNYGRSRSYAFKDSRR
jgi:ABC-type multidrug transport system permease subunit